MTNHLSSQMVEVSFSIDLGVHYLLLTCLHIILPRIHLSQSPILQSSIPRFMIPRHPIINHPIINQTRGPIRSSTLSFCTTKPVFISVTSYVCCWSSLSFISKHPILSVHCSAQEKKNAINYCSNDELHRNTPFWINESNSFFLIPG